MQIIISNKKKICYNVIRSPLQGLMHIVRHFIYQKVVPLELNNKSHRDYLLVANNHLINQNPVGMTSMYIQTLNSIR